MKLKLFLALKLFLQHFAWADVNNLDSPRPLNLEYPAKIMATKNGIIGSAIPLDEKLEMSEFYGDSFPSFERQLQMALQYGVLDGSDIESINQEIIEEKRAIQKSAAHIDDKVIYEKQLDRASFIPLTLTDTEKNAVLLAAAAGVVVFKNDDKIDNWVQKNYSNSASADKIANVGNKFAAVGPLIAGSYLIGVLIENDEIKEVGAIVFSTFTVQTIIMTVAKLLSGRARPYMNQEANNFGNNGRKEEFKSFYSAHTASSFTLATLISEKYGKEKPWVPYVAYGAATLTAFARIKGRQNYASDTLVGATIGVIGTNLVIDAFNGNKSHRGGVLFLPRFCENGKCVGIDFYWKPSQTEEKICKDSFSVCFDRRINSK